MKRSIIDIRDDGPHVMFDPAATGVWHYNDDALAEAGAIPQVENVDRDTLEMDVMPAAAQAVEVAFKTATSAALGAFFDAVLMEGFNLPLAQKLLGVAFENMKSRTPIDVIKGLYR